MNWWRETSDAYALKSRWPQVRDIDPNCYSICNVQIGLFPVTPFRKCEKRVGEYDRSERLEW